MFKTFTYDILFLWKMSPLVTFTITGFHFLSFRFVPSYELITICDICRHKVNFFIFIVLSVSKYSRFLVFKLRPVSAISYAASQSRHGISCTSRCVFALGRGLFRRLETTSNDVDPDFGRSSLRCSRFFRPNSGDPPKKKVFTEIQSIFLADFRWSQKKRSSARISKK